MATLRYISFGDEQTYGTAVAATKYKDLVSENLAFDPSYQFMSATRRRSVMKHLGGAKIVRGDVIAALAPEPDARLFYYFLGTDTPSTLETGVYQHLMTPADSLTKSFTSRVGADILERVIPGCLINQLKVDMIASEPTVVWTASMLGATETKDTIQTSPTFSATSEFQWHQGTITIASGAKTYCRSLSLTMDNGMNLERMYVIKATKGDQIGRIEVGEFVVTGSLDMGVDDATEYDRFLAGADFALNAKFEGVLAGATQKFTFEIDLPQIIYNKDAVPHIEKRLPLKINAPFKAMYNTSAGYIASIKFINNEATLP